MLTSKLAIFQTSLAPKLCRYHGSPLVQKSLWHLNFNHCCSLSQAHKSNISLLAVLMGPELFHAAIKTYIFIKAQEQEAVKSWLCSLEGWIVTCTGGEAGLAALVCTHWVVNAKMSITLRIIYGIVWDSHMLSQSVPQWQKVSIKRGDLAVSFCPKTHKAGILRRAGVPMCSREECLAVFCEKMQGYGGKGWLQDLVLWEREKICQWNRRQAPQSSNCRCRYICASIVPEHLEKLSSGKFCI